MQQLNGADFTLAVRTLAGMRAWLNCDSAMSNGSPALLGYLIGEAVQPTIDLLPLSEAVKAQLAKLRADAVSVEDTPPNCRILGTRTEVFLDSLTMDLGRVVFLVVGQEDTHLYAHDEPLFGQRVAHVFRDAEPDIAAAARCLALSEPTAAVFHSMRAAEVALRRLAKGLGIRSSELKNWGDVLKQIDGKLKLSENEKATTRRDKRLAYFAAARADFAAFNFAWRRYVAHAHKTYDASEARLVFVHLRALMQRLADPVPR